MDDLLGSLFASSDQEPEDEEPTGDPLAGFMNNLASGGMPEGAGASGDAPAGGQEKLDVSSLLGALMGGGASTDAQSSGDMSGLIGALMGGGAPAGSQSSGDMSGLLGALMGGGAPAGAQSSGDMGGLLGALMGGSQASSSASSPLTSIVTSLAEKLGLPPQIAELVVGFVLNKLLAGSRGGAQVASRSAGGVPAEQGMDELLTKMSSGQGIDAQFLESTGLTTELSQQTGLDPETAAASLQEVLGMLGGKTS